MSTIVNDTNKSGEFRSIIEKDRDVDQLYQNINQSIKVSKYRQHSRENLEQSWPTYRQSLKFISQLTHIPSDILNNYARTLFFLLLLGLIFPFNLLIILFTSILSSLINLIPYKQVIAKSNTDRHRILISGGRTTKALQLCRSFHQAGHQIVLVDESPYWLTGHRWSNSVERFYVHPSPIHEPTSYIKTLANIVRKEKIDLFIPSISFPNAQMVAQIKSALSAHGCSTFHIDTDEMFFINNRYAFMTKAQSLGLTVPTAVLITSRKQLLDFDLNGSHSLYICKHVLHDPLNQSPTIILPRSTPSETIEYINKLSISEESPYVLQEFISGKKYCTHGTCIDGKLTLFTCSRVSTSTLNYRHTDHSAILEWCTRYSQALKLTGHLSITFIVDEKDEKAYAIDCNSYVSSTIINFYNHPNVANAYFPSDMSAPMIPLTSARSIYWLPNELWYLFRNIRSMKRSVECLKNILHGKEAIWSWNDPFPFFLHYHIHIFYLLFANLFSRRIRFFHKIDCRLGKLV